jgi:dTMP kinase
MDPRGKMIVLEGVDGVGKSTAAELVTRRLADRGLDVAHHDFPVYGEPHFGPLVAAVLNGGLRIEGDRRPEVIATLFAGNRAATAPALRAELDAGRTLLCDRYHLSNAAFQGAQLSDPAELDEFLQWVLDVELDILGVLRPDVCLWLRLPLELRPERDGSSRAYLEGREDVYERDLALQARVHTAYEHLAGLGAVTPVDLAPEGVLLPPEAVADAVLAAIDAAT